MKACWCHERCYTRLEAPQIWENFSKAIWNYAWKHNIGSGGYTCASVQTIEGFLENEIQLINATGWQTEYWKYDLKLLFYVICSGDFQEQTEMQIFCEMLFATRTNCYPLTLANQ